MVPMPPITTSHFLMRPPRINGATMAVKIALVLNTVKAVEILDSLIEVKKATQ